MLQLAPLLEGVAEGTQRVFLRGEIGHVTWVCFGFVLNRWEENDIKEREDIDGLVLVVWLACKRGTKKVLPRRCPPVVVDILIVGCN